MSRNIQIDGVSLKESPQFHGEAWGVNDLLSIINQFIIINAGFQLRTMK